jgi:hypothetical protein
VLLPWWLALPWLIVYGSFWALVLLIRLMVATGFVILVAVVWAIRTVDARMHPPIG